MRIPISPFLGIPKTWLAGGLILALLLPAGNVLAQGAPGTPPPPGTIPTALGGDPSLDVQPSRRPGPPPGQAGRSTGAGPELPQPPSDPRHDPARRLRVQVGKILFVGNTLFSPDELAILARPYERRVVSLADLRELCARIRLLYLERGYFLARAGVPPQRMRNGVMRIAVSEGRVGRIRVLGNQYYSTQFILEMFSPALDEGILRQDSVERALLILNEFPDLKVRSLFDIGKAPGTTDITLQVTDSSPLHFGIDYNNYGNTLVGRHRAGTSVTGGNIFTDGDEGIVHAVFPFPSESLPFYQSSYAVPVNRYGTRVGASYATAKTRVGEGPLEVLDIRGDADILTFTASHPLRRDLRSSTNISAGLVGKDVRNFVFENVIVSEDKLREFTLGYDGSYLGDESRTQGSLLLTQGLGEWFGARKNGDPLTSRPGARAGNGFSKMNGNLAYLWGFAPDHFLLLRTGGQLTTRPLTVPELFPLGGPDSVRGYIQSEFLGDYGYTASAEYRLQLVDSRDFSLQGAAFIDTGSAEIKRPLVNEVASRDLTGAGFGVRAWSSDNLSLRVDLGFPVSGRDADDDGSVLYGQMNARW